MIEKIVRLFQTVSHLRLVQIYYQIFYRIRNGILKPQKLIVSKLNKVKPLNLIDSIKWCSADFDHKDGRFEFLNQAVIFNSIYPNWNYSKLGLLWGYNLNYFEFLHHENCSKEIGLALIHNYCYKLSELTFGLDPYPTSVRTINWIKFLVRWKISDDIVDSCLFSQYSTLYKNFEYHLLANHLLENSFSLLFGAYYFQNERFYKKAKSTLVNQLKEQILEDGAHYERSAMYHGIILSRTLDSLNLTMQNDWKQNELDQKLSAIAEKMVAWLKNITFDNGQIPNVKDAAPGIAPSTDLLLDYAFKLGIDINRQIELTDSMYRKFKVQSMELLIDIGTVSPSYQPGHAHADELNFILNAKGVPVIVDAGVSTYEKNARRHLERSTSSHNCMVVNNKNSSQVWGGFRVAKRANVQIIEDSLACVYAKHDGYERQGLTLERSFRCLDNKIIIENYVVGDLNGAIVESYLHFHPDEYVTMHKSIIKTKNIQIRLEGFLETRREKYMFASGFHSLREATQIILKVTANSKMTIYAN